MEILKISSKGQIVIPQKMRKNLGIKKGTMVAVNQTDDKIILKKVDSALVNKIKRSLEDIKKGRIKEWKG